MSYQSFIHEDFYATEVTGADLDRLLAQGWRHAGVHFYRYNLTIHQGALTEVIPLRVRLANFQPSKNQRRILRKNADFRVEIRPIAVDAAKKLLFHEHKRKFSGNIPEGLHDYLSDDPASVPCEGREVAVYDGARLIAASFFDVGERALSSIYGMYDLDYEWHGLGLYTMLLEIDFAQRQGMDFYYHGYCFRAPSFYDYKKRFRELEGFDWNGRWLPLALE